MATWAIPLAALIISISTFLLGVKNRRTAADQSWVATLEKRLERAEADVKVLQNDVKKCEDHREGLLRERVTMMGQLIDALKKQGS